MHIDTYSFGSITIDGKTYQEDLIAFPDRIKTSWWRKAGHSLAIEDLGEVINYKPELLIVGKGASGCMEVPSEIKKLLAEQQIGLIDKNTAQACQLFNKEIEKGRKVAAAFHLTC